MRQNPREKRDSNQMDGEAAAGGFAGERFRLFRRFLLIMELGGVFAVTPCQKQCNHYNVFQFVVWRNLTDTVSLCRNPLAETLFPSGLEGVRPRYQNPEGRKVT